MDGSMKLCPFCGSKDVRLVRGSQGYSVYCEGCKTQIRFLSIERDYNQGRFTTTADDAEQETIRHWNMRHYNR